MKASLTAGSKLYKYRLIRPIGRGHFGEVWVADDLAISQQLAIKILDGTMAPVAEVLREAKVGHRLNHANLVKVHNADVIAVASTKLVFIAMDYLPSGPITSLANAADFVTAPKAIAATIDVLRGLEYLHNANLFHNDIKPSNILLGSRGEALLSDYGISCTSPGLAPATASSAYVLHRAPETAATNRISVATDIYQVGLTLFRLLNGIGLVADQRSRLGAMEFEAQKTKGHVPAVTDYQPFIGRALRQIIAKSTAPAAADRYQSALEMRRALERLQPIGYWDANASGNFFGMVHNHKITYQTTSPKVGIEIETRKENLSTGRNVRVTRFCLKGLTAGQVEIARRAMMQAVVDGTI